jgi:DNA-binding CsgD family transcriptional regulator
MLKTFCDPHYEQLIGLLYEGATEAQPFTRFLDALREWLSADRATMLLERQRRDWPGVIFSADGKSERINHYRNLFAQDPFKDLPAGEVVTLCEHLGQEAFERSTFMEEFMRPHGMLHVLGADVIEPGGIRIRLRVSRFAGRDDFNVDEKARLTPLLAHVERVMGLFIRLANAETELELFEGVLTRLAVATVVIDRDCRILHASPLANELFAEGDALRNDRGILKIAGSPSQTNALAQAAAYITDSDVMQPVLPETRFLHCTRGGGSHLGLQIRPVPPSAKFDAPLRGTALVIIIDPDRDIAPPPEMLRQLYGFTRAEAELAALMGRGFNLDEASDLLDISKHTGRAHLRAIYAKTGATRQSGLVRMLLRSVDEFESKH